MKKLLLIFFVAVLMLTCAGCGDTDSDNDKKSESAETPAKIGVLMPISLDEAGVKRWTENVAVAEGKAPGYVNDNTIILFNDPDSMLLALKSKQIDRFDICKSTGNYIAKRNDDVEVIDKHRNPILGYSIAMKNKYAPEIAEIDQAIVAMKEDGTLTEIINETITNLDKDEPVAKPLPHIEGAPTIKIAITGDLPPMDCILGDGTPAGFNVAFLSELSKRINKNFELVTVDAAARGPALYSDQVDALFWVTGTYSADGKALGYPLDHLDRVTISSPYIMDSRVSVKLKD